MFYFILSSRGYEQYLIALSADNGNKLHNVQLKCTISSVNYKSHEKEICLQYR